MFFIFVKEILKYSLNFFLVVFYDFALIQKIFILFNNLKRILFSKLKGF